MLDVPRGDQGIDRIGVGPVEYLGIDPPHDRDVRLFLCRVHIVSPDDSRWPVLSRFAGRYTSGEWAASRWGETRGFFPDRLG
jgi:hypothetical protein